MSKAWYKDPTAAQAINRVMRETKNGKNIRRGDIFYIKDEETVTGSEQEQHRPAVIVSNNECNKVSPVVEVVFLTTKYKTPLPTHTTVKGIIKSTALCEQIHSISVHRLGKFIRTCTVTEMHKIDECLLVSLGLDKRRVL